MASNRDEKMKEITERLEQGVQEIFTSERYTEYLRTMSQFHSYSFNNTLLIAMQKPDATLVAGYQAWQKKFNRHVKRGERGIQIISPAPIREKEVQEKVDEKTGELVLRPDGQPETEEVVHVIPRFRVTTVFDISQTDGEPLPDLGVEELTADVENYENFMKAIEQVSLVPIRFDEISSGAKGYYDNGSKEIVIQQDMSESQTLKTAIHETAHAILHDRDIMQAQGIQKDQMTRECEAESVAFSVCQHFGIDTSDYSFPYIASWSSGREMKELRASMDTIRHTAAEMIDGITEAVQNLQREQVQYTSVELFGTPALFDIGRVADENIPAGLYRYEMRGADNDPSVPETVENHVTVNHAATVLTAYPLPIPESGYLRLGEGLDFGAGGMITVQDYRQITAGLSSFEMGQRVQNAVIRANEELLFSGNQPQYAIYQIDRQGSGNDYLFMNMEFVQSHDMTVRGGDYRLVYGGVLQPQETLDTLYEKFNVARPDDFAGHSLSVSDVVVIIRDGEAKAHYVDSVGFTELPDFVQERRTALEQQSRAMTEHTDSIELDGHEGSWHTVDQTELMGETFYLMEHNEFGSDVAKVAVNENGEVVAEDLWNGFDEGFHEAVAEYFAAKGVTYERPEPTVEESEVTETAEPGAVKKPEAEAAKATELGPETVAQDTITPVYMQTPAYAREHGELEQYRQSRDKNIACKNAIEEAVSENFDGMHLNADAIKPVIEQFGEERVAYVLATTIQMKDWDGRFSPSNKEWAASIPTGEDISPFGNDRRVAWTVESHPAVLDGFVNMFREEVQAREAEQELTADEITNFMEISREYYPHMRTAEYVFSCEVRGESDVLTYEVSQHDDGESYSLHTKNNDIWNRMSRKELEKLEFVVSREVTFAEWQKEIEQAETAADLRDVNYGMMETEHLNLSDEQRGRLYQMMDEKEKSFQDSQIDAISPVSDRTEPAVSLHGRSMADVEETVLSYAQAEIDAMGLHDEVQLLGARVYGSRSREGLYTDSSDLDVVISYSGNISEDDLFNALHESGLSIAGIPVDINPISTEKTGSLEDYLTTAEAYLDEREAQAADEINQNPETAVQEPTISFYVAECMEFPVLGEYHEDIGSLQEAIALYEQIPAERMNGIKGIGFTLTDGSMYDGMSYELMSAGIVSRDLVEEIPHFKESPLVQKALAELEETYRSPRNAEQEREPEVTAPAEMPSEPQERPQTARNPEQGERHEVTVVVPGGRKESVLQALRERQAKIKAQEAEKPQQKSQSRKKGEQEL